MDESIKKAELLFEGHSCSDCETEFICKGSSICEKWIEESESTKQMKLSMVNSAVDMLTNMISKEMKEEIDRLTMENVYGTRKVRSS